MASILLERSSEIDQLFREISSKFSTSESEDVVKSSKRIYGEQFKSLGNQDLLSCLSRFYEFDYVSNKKLALIKDFVAAKSKNEKEIKERIENFKNTHPLQPEPEKDFKGRIDEIKKITEKLKMKEKPVVNLYGSAGVGKTTLAKEICEKWTGQTNIFDLREAKDIRAVYLNIMGTFGINIPVGFLDIGRVVGRIHDHIKEKSKGERFLFLFDNVEQFTKGKGKEGKNLRTQFIQFLSKLSEFEGNAGTLNLLLTSRTQLKYSEVIDYELKPLEDSFSEKILLPGKTSNVDVQQKNKLLGICKGVPLLLKGTAAILKQRRKSPGDLIDDIEMTSKRETKYEQEPEERPFDTEEEGIDERQTSMIREMFYTLPSDSLRISAVSVSLFHGPFSTVTAAKILGVSISEAVAQLEGLVTNEIIHVVDEDAMQLMYDIHPLLRRYGESITNDVMFCESYIEAKGRFHEHFMSRMKKIATFVESDYVRAFNEFARDRPNFEFTIDISLLPEYFSVPGGYHENALIASLFNAMLVGKKQTELFHSWAEMCKDDGNAGSLFRAQLRCWEAKQVLEARGTRDAFESLEKASLSLKQVHDQSTESFKLTKGLYLYCEGEIYYKKKDYQKGIECLEWSLDLMESPLKLDTNLARCYNALGNCYYGLKRPDKALEFYNKALKMREELSGCDYHFDMPVYKNQIGTVHEDKGEYHEAVKCYKDALELLKELKLTGFEDEALFRRNLANVYVRLKKYTEADEEAEKAHNIRQKVLGDHPDTVRSIFQRGVIQANLRAFKNALDFFLEAWEMEKTLVAGNHSEVWRLIIKGVFDMYDFLKNKDSEKEEFRQNALKFCQRFWKEEKLSPHFSYTAYNKGIIDGILDLLSDKKEDKALKEKYQKEALWFHDGMQKEKGNPSHSLFKQTLRKLKEVGAFLRPKEVKPVLEETSSNAGEEEEEIVVEDVESDEDIEEKSDEVSDEVLEGDVKERSFAVFRKMVTSEGAYWALPLGAVHLMFPPNAVSEPTSVEVHRWKYSVRSPPLQEHEAITSNVIELSIMDGQNLKFNTKVKLSLSHSATDLRGYELVIKRLVDEETNKWEDVDGTRDIRCLQEMKDHHPSHMEIPNSFFPLVQADITECSTYAVVCRLRSSPTYTITSNGGSFIHPDFPGVAVTIPENAVDANAEFPLELKVQEVPSNEFQDDEVLIGPILRISCCEVVQFLRPVTIQLPISLREQQDLSPDPTTCRVRVLFLKSVDKQKEWIEITDDLVGTTSFDGKFVRFEVKRFSGYSPSIDRRKENSNVDKLRLKRFMKRFICGQPRPVVFIAYFEPGSSYVLSLICCPGHLKQQEIQELKVDGIRPSHGSSKKNMIPKYDKAFVVVSGGIHPFNEEEMEDCYLWLHKGNLPFYAQIKVCVVDATQTAQVKFRNTGLWLCTLNLTIPTQNTDSTQQDVTARNQSEEHCAVSARDHSLLIAKLYSLGVKPTAVNWVADFLRSRYQRVKLKSDCLSDFKPVPAGIPQGTRIGPWLFLVMINDLTSSNALSSMWKFADDTTVSEIVPKFGASVLQDTVHDVLRWSNDKLNSLKCKELRIDFRRKNNLDTVSLEANGNTFEIVKSAKVLGVTVRNDLKWIDHVDDITMKASRRIYLFKQLKRAGIDRKSLILFYCACICSVLEYACQAFHTILPAYLSDQIERVQKRVFRILFPEVSYSKALEDAGLKNFFHRREELCSSLFNK